ncbi:MAG: UbiD family decarboxylase, partial [Thermodesulfobacteriota bacterium]
MTDAQKYPVDYEDLAAFLEALREDGDMLEIDEEVDPRFEIGAVLRELGEREGPAAMFTKVAGRAGKVVVGNVLGHRRRAARALGVSVADLTETYLARQKLRLPPERTENAPVMAVRVGQDDLDLFQALPALTHHGKDTSPYLTCGVTLARDPETGRPSMGLHRIQVQSKNRLGIYLATPPLSHFLQKARLLNRPLEVATVLGPDPAVLLAAVTWCPEGDNKLEIAGGLRGKPVPVVRGGTVDLLAPAQAQYLIEGVIHPGETAPEGVFGESSGIYVKGALSPVIRVQALYHRERPLFQALQPWTGEDDTLLNLCFGSGLLEDLRKKFGLVKDLHLIPGTVCAHAVISVADGPRPLVRSALTSLLTGNPFIKMAIAVNDDIDPRNYREVEWAVATRFQADRDLILLPGLYGSVIDPSAGPDA